MSQIFSFWNPELFEVALAWIAQEGNGLNISEELHKRPKLIGSLYTLLTIACFFQLPYAQMLMYSLLVSSLYRMIVNTLKDRTQELGASLVESTKAIGKEVRTAVANVTDVLEVDKFSWENVVKNAQAHPLGLTSSVGLIGSANSPTQFVSAIGCTASMLGFEKSLLASALGQGAASAGKFFGIGAKEQSLDEAFDSVRNSSSWNRKRFTGLAALGLSLSGKEGVDFLEPISKAVKHQAAVEKAWDNLEEFLNSIGVVNTGKWAYLKELQEAYEEIKGRFEEYNTVLATGGSEFCKSDFYRGYLDFRNDIRRLDNILAKNTCSDLKSSNLLISLSQLKLKVEQWDQTIANLRATKAIRPVPTGVCIFGPSHIGKTDLISELIRKVTTELEKRAASTPNLEAFKNAKKWTKWNVQQRDEYDTGYHGDEITYMDDGFSDTENKDHPMILTFISGEGIGTVGAALGDKGKPYSSRLFIMTANSLPSTSISINNIYAIHERFPITIQVRPLRKPPAKGQPYDHEFKHLQYHVGPMAQHCGLKTVTGNRGKTTGNNCEFPKGKVTCDLPVLDKLDELVKMIVDDMIDNDERYRARFAQQFAQEQMDVFGKTVHEEDEDNEEWENVSDSELSSTSSTTDCSEEINKLLAEASEEDPGSESETERPPSPEPETEPERTPDEIQEPDDPLIRGQTETGPVSHPEPPPCVAPPKMRLAAPKEVTMKSTEFRFLCSAYRSEPIESSTDPRIAHLWDYFVHNRTGKTLTECLREKPIDDPQIVFNYLACFGVPEDQKDEFLQVWMATFKDPVRIHGAAGAYILCTKLDLGQEALPCPKIPGRVHEFRMEDPTHEPILMLATYLANQEVRRLKNTEFSVWRIRNTLEDYIAADIANITSNVSQRLILGHYTAGLYATVVGGLLRLLGIRNSIPLLQNMMNVVFIRRLSGMLAQRSFTVCRILAEAYERSTMWKPLKILLTGCTAPLAFWVDCCQELVQRICSYWRTLADFGSWCVFKIAELLGIPLSETMEYLVSASAVVGVSILAATLIPIMGAILRWFYNYLTGNEESKKEKTVRGILTPRKNQEQSVTSSKLRSTRRQRRERPKEKEQSIDPKVRRAAKRKMKVREQFSVVSALFDNQLDEADKENFYLNGEPCPFCDDEKLDAVECEEYGSNHLWRSNLHPRAPQHKMAITKAHCEKSWGPVFVEEFNVCVELAAEMNLSAALIEKSEGPNGGGSVPHSHTHLMWEEGLLAAPLEVSQPCQVASVKTYNVGQTRLIEIVVWAHNDAMQEVMDTLTPLYEALGKPSWSMDGYYRPGVTELVFFFSHSFKEEREQPLVRDDIKVLRPFLLKLSGIVPLNIEDVFEAEEQGLDDAAVALCKQFVTSHQVQVRRVGANVNQTLADLREFDSLISGGSAAVVSGDECFFPHHIAQTGSYVKVYPLGEKPLYTPSPKQPYLVYKVTKHSETDQLARAIQVKKGDMSYHLYSMGLPSDLPNMSSEFAPHASWLDKHAVTDKELVDASVGAIVLQWLPTVGVLTTGTLGAVATSTFRFEGRVAAHRVVEVQAASHNISTTKDGDCGGMLFLANPSCPRKFIGFHCIGNSESQWSTILTQEQLKFIRTCVSEQGLPQEDPRIRPLADKTDLTLLELAVGKDGGLGHHQLENWPRIEWAKHPNYQLVAPGIGPDVPVGPGVKPIGILRYDQSASGNAKSGWRKSPFFGCFDVLLEPSITKIGDPRRTATLPQNRLGEETLLWPNQKMAEMKGEVDLSVLRSVLDQFFTWFRSQFIGEQIGNRLPTIEYALEVGLNGVPLGTHVTGLITDASAGIPWTVSAAHSKKSKLVSIDGVGRRDWNGIPGRVLKNVCAQKLAYASTCRRVPSFCASKLKDCLVKQKHVVNGKTRVFNASAVESVVCANALFGHFKEAYLKKRFQMFHAVGIDVNSTDWNGLWQHLQYHPNVFDIDFANFDKNLLSVFIRGWYSIVIETIQAVSPDGWSEARYVLAEEDVTSLMVDNRSIYFTEHSNKSGTAMTTITNGGVNVLMLFYAFSQWLGRVDFGFFMENVRVVTFGDDLIISLSDRVRGFDRVVFVDILKGIGQEATAASKDDTITPFCTWEEVSFLKGTTKFFHGLHIYALERASIEATFGWSQVEHWRTDVWADIVRTHLKSAIAHGKEYYEQFRSKLLDRVNSRRFDGALRAAVSPYLAVGFDDAAQSLRDELAGISN